MNSIEWSALLVLNGLSPIHEAGERIAAATPSHRHVDETLIAVLARRGPYKKAPAETIAERLERKQAYHREWQRRDRARKLIKTEVV